MKTFFIYTLIFFATRGWSQPTLTYGDVYNFDIGDIVQAKRSSYIIPNQYGVPGYVTNKILNKSLASNSTSVTYTIQQTIYSPPPCQTCSATSSSSIISQTFTNLSAYVADNNVTNCYALADTSYIAYNNKRTYEVHPVIITTNCLEPNKETDIYIEGVGKFTDVYIGAGHAEDIYELVYYIKQSGTYGPTYIAESKKELYLNIVYPNPTHDIIYLESNSELFYYDIYDLHGKRCKSDFILSNQINIKDLESGIYIANVSSTDQRIKTIKIIKN